MNEAQQIGKWIHLFRGDCLHLLEMDIMHGFFHACITDPPYIVGYKSGLRVKTKGIMTEEIDNDSNPDIIRRSFPLIYRALREDSCFYCFSDNEPKLLAFFQKEMERAGFQYKSTLIWEKNVHTAGDLETGYGRQYECCLFAVKGSPKMFWEERPTDLIRGIDKIPPGNMVHPNQKPVPLLERIMGHCTLRGDDVLDPFCGSGSTGLAGHRMERNVVLMEKNSEHHKRTRSRLLAETAIIGLPL